MHSSMYYSPEIYDLERRAIFSKQWMLISHKARYRETGEFVQYEMAGFNFVVVKNKEQKLVAFHNICRHRAFPVIQAASGKARIFSCKYHGWSYDLNGKLTKAPRFSDGTVDGFDTSNIGLFPLHVHVDRNGFVYVNLDTKDTPEVPWEAQYGQIAQQEVLINAGVDWDKVEYDFTWKKEGDFNWKLMQDNYNEVRNCRWPSNPYLRFTVLSLSNSPLRCCTNHQPRHILRRTRLSRCVHLPLQRAEGLRRHRVR